MSGEITKRGRGQPPYVPTMEDRILTERLVGLLVPEKTICSQFIKPAISYPTFRKYFKEEIKSGRDSLRGRLRALWLRSAESGNVTALLYLSARIDPEFHKMAQDAPMMPGVGVEGTGFDPSGGVVFYIPENGRDKDAEPVTLEGASEAAA